jgi:hypothetical protein
MVGFCNYMVYLKSFVLYRRQAGTDTENATSYFAGLVKFPNYCSPLPPNLSCKLLTEISIWGIQHSSSNINW